jgi:DNA-binding IclR family transcriptional regulator
MRIVAEQGFGDPRELGRNAIGDIAGLAEALVRTRHDGFATAYEEGEPGMAAAAAAIPGPRPARGPVGTVSVAGPTVRMSRSALRELGPRLVEAAIELSELWPIRRFQPAAATPDSVTAGSHGA